MANNLVVLGIDPGIRHCGYALLSGTERIMASGTWRPGRNLKTLPRHCWFMDKIAGILADFHPTVLGYEEFVWMEGPHDEQYVSGRPWMERLIGGLITLAHVSSWHPELISWLPQVWGAQLLGERQHTKAQIAWAVNQRLSTGFKGNTQDNHEADALGLALVSLDHVRVQAYQDSHTRKGS